MIKMLSWSQLLLVALLLSLTSLVMGYRLGHLQGTDAERSQHSASTVTMLASLLDAHTNLLTQSQAASNSMRQALGARSALNRKMTVELKNELATTKAERTDCRFDDDSMRHLTEARERAATSAASGIRHPLPGTGSASQQPR